MLTNIRKGIVVSLLLVLSGPLWADNVSFGLDELRDLFPVADHLVKPEKISPLVKVYRGDVLLGYAYVTTDVIRIPAYSGKPIDTLVALDTRGEIRGVRILSHEEPILVIGISDQHLQHFLDQYEGKTIGDRLQIGGRSRHGSKVLDGISGATITVMVLNASITRSLQKAREVLEEEQADHTGNTVDNESGPIWIQVWQDRLFRIVVLVTGLTVLLFILFLQDWLARHPVLLQRLRTGFLLYTVVFIGWYSLAQLSIVNVLTFVRSLIHQFSWESFLIDPSMFILWSFVAMTILLWGRGVYCGWLCPFGALQEFVFRIGRGLKIPSFEFPEVVHERLWAIKYIILIGLFGLSLHSMPMAETYAEVEPFKTAITL
ncbi:MAG: 4Fe-4S binding protein, partial [Thiohalophilus sp.]